MPLYYKIITETRDISAPVKVREKFPDALVYHVLNVVDKHLEIKLASDYRELYIHDNGNTISVRDIEYSVEISKYDYNEYFIITIRDRKARVTYYQPTSRPIMIYRVYFNKNPPQWEMMVPIGTQPAVWKKIPE